MDWSAWGPTIVSIITCIFFAGVLYSNQASHERRLDEHNVQIEDHTKELRVQAIEIGMIKAFQDGYTTAKALYEHRRQPQE